MASPVSFGDAYLMATLALRLAHAFTKGRKSAPAEFREVENQLYSLSAALNALDNARSLVSTALAVPAELTDDGGKDTLGTMLQSCRDTLEHLEQIVQKYSRFGEDQYKKEPQIKRWRKDIKTSWMKIAWTTEGGNLAKLATQLSVHVNSLNLILGVAMNAQANKVGDQVGHVVQMLTEIHSWFTDNLKGTVSSKSMQTYKTDIISQLDIFFQALVITEGGNDLVCNRATLNPYWVPTCSTHASNKSGALNTASIFSCRCVSETNTPEAKSHQGKVESYGLSPLTFPVRLTTNPRSWVLYKVTNLTSNQLVSLIIKDVPITHMALFEQSFIQDLCLRQAGAMIRQNMSNMLVHVDPTTSDQRVLHIASDMSGFQNCVEEVSFVSKHRTYSRGPISSIQILHYKSPDMDPDLQNRSMHTCFVYVNTAEIVLTYDPADGDTDISTTILYLEHNTVVDINKDDTSILIRNISCASFSPDKVTKSIPSIDVRLQLASSEAVDHLRKVLGEMRMELFVISLQFPQENEKRILFVQAGQVHSEEIHISDAEISVVQNNITQRLRLIISSKNGVSILSQELSENFTSALMTPDSKPAFTSLTYLVQMDTSGVRKLHIYPNGFQHLEFSDFESNRLFDLCMGTITGRLTMRNSH